MTQTLGGRMRARTVDLRGLDSPEIQRRANALFLKVGKTASDYEQSGDPAADVADAAIYKHSVAMAGLMGSITAAVPGGVSTDRDVMDRAHQQALEIFLKFKADMSAYLKQQIIELRAERANCRESSLEGSHR